MTKRVDREGPIQEAIVNYLEQVMPDALVHHCRNEINKRGKGNGWVKNNIAMELAKAKRRGMKPGFPDIIVLPYANVGALFFEVKAEGNPTQPNQDAIHAHMTRLGYRVAVVRSIDDVRECLQSWGVGFVEKIPTVGQVVGDRVVK